MAAAESVVKSGQPLPAVGGYRAVSSDDDTRSILFNRDIQDVLSDEFGGQRRLDLLGFDACLMGMLETGYGFAPYVRMMVASEELEEGEGWHYAPWLRFLTQNPGATPEALSAAVVDAYAKRYGNSYLATLSAVRLDGTRQVAGKLSAFAKAVLDKAAIEAPLLLQARKKLTAYGASAHPPLHTSIDLIALLEQYEKRTGNVGLKNLSAALRKEITGQVLVNYASRRSSDPASDGLPYGSRGLAIYFPSSKSEFTSDPYHDGYLKANTYKPVDFVRNESWADLLYRVLGIP